MEKDKEIWKVIPGYSGYEASSHGNIRNSHSSSLIRQKFSYNDCKNYLSVGLYHDHEGYNTRYVHQLVCEAFHGPRPEKDPVKGNYVTNHIDGNKHNNRADNLEWVLHSDNMIHAMQIGLRNDNVDVEIIDVLENKTYKFHSINAATHFLKVDRGVLYYLLARHTELPFDGRYIFKYNRDKLGKVVRKSYPCVGYDCLEHKWLEANSWTDMSLKTGIPLATIALNSRMNTKSYLKKKGTIHMCYGYYFFRKGKELDMPAYTKEQAENSRSLLYKKAGGKFKVDL